MVLTDNTITVNRPGIIWTDKSRKKTVLIDIAVPNTNNLRDTYGAKICKYKDLAIEIQ